MHYVAQNLLPLVHLLNGVGRKQVIVNQVEFVRIFAVVTFRPLLCIADCTYRAQVDRRHDITLRGILDKIRERQSRGVRVLGVASHDERKCTYLGGPEQIGVGCRLGSAFCHALMDRSEFVHVVRLVTAGTCVQEREHTCNQ